MNEAKINKPRRKKPIPMAPKSKRPKLTGAIVGGTGPCTCGHTPEEHGRDPEYPGSTACQSDLGSDVPGDGCDCVAYEADSEDARAAFTELRSRS